MTFATSRHTEWLSSHLRNLARSATVIPITQSTLNDCSSTIDAIHCQIITQPYFVPAIPDLYERSRAARLIANKGDVNSKHPRPQNAENSKSPSEIHTNGGRAELSKLK
jgi:hypothetical protein